MPLVQLRAGGAEEKQRHALRPVGEVLEEGEQRLVGPVQVLEHEHRLPPVRPRTRGSAARPRTTPPARPARAAAPTSGSEPGLQPGDVRVVLGQRLLELGRRLLGRVGLEDPALRLHDLAERPERDPVPVGKAASLPPADETRLVVEVAKSSAHRRLLPTPGSPTIVTSWQERCCAARSNVPIRSDFSSSRPTSGVA